MTACGWCGRWVDDHDTDEAHECLANLSDANVEAIQAGAR